MITLPGLNSTRVLFEMFQANIVFYSPSLPYFKACYHLLKACDATDYTIMSHFYVETCLTKNL